MEEGKEARIRTISWGIYAEVSVFLHEHCARCISSWVPVHGPVDALAKCWARLRLDLESGSNKGWERSGLYMLRTYRLHALRFLEGILGYPSPDKQFKINLF